MFLILFAAVNVHKIGGLDASGPWVATTDASVLMEFKPDSLDTVGLIKYPNSIASFGGITQISTAHPHASNGFTYNYVLELRPLPLIHDSNIAHIVRTDPQLNQKIVGSVKIGKGVVPYIHDFSLTDNYAILFVWPIRLNLLKMLNGGGILRQADFLKDIPTKIYVFDIHSKSSVEPIARFETDSMVAYHHINAYEEVDPDGSERIVVDISAYPDGAIMNGEHGFSYIDQLKDPELRKKQEKQAECYRWSLSLKGSKLRTMLRTLYNTLLLYYVMHYRQERAVQAGVSFAAGGGRQRWPALLLGVGARVPRGPGPQTPLQLRNLRLRGPGCRPRSLFGVGPGEAGPPRRRAEMRGN